MRPVSKSYLVKLRSPQQEYLNIRGGGLLHLPAMVSKEEWATIFGEMYSDHVDEGLRSGDEVVISYLVTADYRFVGDSVVYDRLVGDGIWKVDREMILGVRRGGVLEAFGDWCIMEQLYEDTVSSSLLEVTSLSRVLRRGCGRVVSGSDAPVGSIAFFDEKFRSVYQLPSREEYIIINKEYVQAYRWEGGNILV